MEKGDIKLSIIILSYNTKELLRQCLESVIRHRPLITNHQLPITEIIVVDNGSTDGSAEMVKTVINKLSLIDKKSLITNHQLPITIKLIENKENLGYAKGNNIGIKEAQGEYIMLLNSDTVVKENAIGRLVDFLEENPDRDVVGPRLLNLDGTPQPNCGRFPSLPVVAVMLFKEHFGGSEFVRCSLEKSGLVDWLVGAAFMARRDVFEKAGLLDEKLFMYMEEVEWFYRVYQAGFKTYFLKDSEIVHLGRGSSKSGRTEPILNIYKGLLHFYRKHKSRSQLWCLWGMLKLKALLSVMIGFLKNDKYLKETYAQAIKIS